jgi:hypothetical protein
MIAILAILPPQKTKKSLKVGMMRAEVVGGILFIARFKTCTWLLLYIKLKFNFGLAELQ